MRRQAFGGAPPFFISFLPVLFLRFSLRQDSIVSVSRYYLTLSLVSLLRARSEAGAMDLLSRALETRSRLSTVYILF